MSKIADSTREQSTGLGKANIAVSQLDDVTRQNAAMVEETSAAGQLLRWDVEALNGLMADFQVNVPGSKSSGTA